MDEKQKKRAIWAWTMYDWGNSAFATTIHGGCTHLTQAGFGFWSQLQFMISLQNCKQLRINGLSRLEQIRPQISQTWIST